MALNLPLMVIGLATIVVSAWSFYNGKRFAGRERRRAPGRLMGNALALHFGVQPADLTRWQRARRLRVHHDTRGLVVGVETEFGVDKVDRRPADHADPLPWIEGLVVAREEIEAPPVRDLPRHSPVAMPPVSVLLEGEFAVSPPTTPDEAPAQPPPPAGTQARRKSAAKTESESPAAPASGFDPSMLADLGLFTAEVEEDEHQPSTPSAEPESDRDAFRHGGRTFYF